MSKNTRKYSKGPSIK